MSTAPGTPDQAPPTISETLQRSARRAFLLWVETPDGAAHRGDPGAEALYVAGFLAACREWGPFG